VRVSDRLVILHVIDSLGLGGAERFLAALCTALPTDRYQVIVCAVEGEGPYAAELWQAGIELLLLRARGRRDPMALVRLARFMRHRHVDIVHTHLFVGGVFGRIAALLAGVPVRVTTEQNAYAPGHRPPRWQVLANRLLARRTDRLVAVSRGTRDYLVDVERVPPEKIAVVPNAIPWPEEVDAAQVDAVRRELGAAGRLPLIGTVARLTEQKGLAYLLDALSELRQRFPDLHCLLVGEGELRSELEARAERLGLAERVTFCGPRRDVSVILRCLDLFVLPSLFEGLPLSLLEAMAAGTPVVATDVAGSNEAIVDGVNGRLAAPADARALSQIIADVLEHREMAQAMAHRAVETVGERYTIGPVAGAYQSLYTELVSAKRPGVGPS
jgi:glycosyltransferase involved in cell wall biosynthesis